MKLKCNLNEDNYLEMIVALTSLCENNEIHFELLIVSEGELEKELDLVKEALKKYRISIDTSKTALPGGIVFPSNIIVDANIVDILNEIEDSDEKKGLLDYAKSAPYAHDRGLSYKDVKKNAGIIVFPQDRPWLCTNIHYDIEKIWWEYAKKTTVYFELMELFLESALTETFLEDYAIQICEENDRLTAAIKEVRSTIEMLRNM